MPFALVGLRDRACTGHIILRGFSCATFALLAAATDGAAGCAFALAACCAEDDVLVNVAPVAGDDPFGDQHLERTVELLVDESFELDAVLLDQGMDALLDRRCRGLGHDASL